jgi:hypothetical protein
MASLSPLRGFSTGVVFAVQGLAPLAIDRRRSAAVCSIVGTLSRHRATSSIMDPRRRYAPTLFSGEIAAMTASLCGMVLALACLGDTPDSAIKPAPATADRPPRDVGPAVSEILRANLLATTDRTPWEVGPPPWRVAASAYPHLMADLSQVRWIEPPVIDSAGSTLPGGLQPLPGLGYGIATESDPWWPPALCLDEGRGLGCLTANGAYGARRAESNIAWRRRTRKAGTADVAGAFF